MNVEIIPKFKVVVKLFFGIKSSESYNPSKWLKLSITADFYGQDLGVDCVGWGSPFPLTGLGVFCREVLTGTQD